MDVGTADAGCVHPDANLSRTWLRVRDVAGFERLPDGRHYVCFHFLSSCLLNEKGVARTQSYQSILYPICSGIDESSIKDRQYLARRTQFTRCPHLSRTLIGLRARGIDSVRVRRRRGADWRVSSRRSAPGRIVPESRLIGKLSIQSMLPNPTPGSRIRKLKGFQNRPSARRCAQLRPPI